jgi:glycine betaine/proline transport system ATP-binding protein
MQDEFSRLQKMLKKTIVFITHDFEEATRLADRIGIMKDGRMVQMGTPEELILHPANDYVAAFAQNAPRDRIVSAKAIMEPLSTCNKATSSVPLNAKIGTIAAQVIAADTPVPVIDTSGNPVGQISRQIMSDALFGTTAS